MQQDIPSRIDLNTMADAQEWADTVMLKRPYRSLFFQQITDIILANDFVQPRILELGSGPGFLAQFILQHVPCQRYVALDFSAAMHQLAQQRLDVLAHQVEFVKADFKQDHWLNDLGQFDIVVSMQAVHELRHKRHTVHLFKQIKTLMTAQSLFLFCDHFAGATEGMQDHQLFMTPQEQHNSLIASGFTQVELLLKHGTLTLHSANI